MDFVASFAEVLDQFPSDRSALKNARVIAVANQRGGVGKTTTAVHLAIGLAAAGKRVALIDMDPQMSATLLMGQARFVDHLFSEEANGSIAQVLSCDSPPILRTPDWAKKRNWPLVAVPGSEGLAALEYQWMQKRHGGRHCLLTKVVAPLREAVDFIVIDTPPSLSLLTINSLWAADTLLVPTTCTAISLRGARQVILTAFHLIESRQIAGRKPLALLGAVKTNRFRSAVQSVMESTVDEIFGRTAFPVSIPRRTKVEEAEAKQIPLLSSRTDVVKAYKTLTQQVLERVS